MGDVRFVRHFDRLMNAPERTAALLGMSDDEVVEALAEASRRHDPLLANVLSSEAMNRMRRATAISAHLLEGTLAFSDMGVVSYANHAAGEKLMLPRAQLVGARVQDVLELKWEDGRPLRKNPFETVLLGAQPVVLEGVLVARRGAAPFPARLTCAPIVREGEVDGGIVTFADITQRRLQEREISESRRFLQATIDALESHLAIVDEDTTILAVNRAWVDFGQANGLGWENHGIGRQYLSVCRGPGASDDNPGGEFATGVQAVIDGSLSGFSLEYPCHSPTEQRWFIARVTRFDWAGPLRVVIAHENITERKLAELRILELVDELLAHSDVHHSH